MNKAEQIANAIWGLRSEYDNRPSTERCMRGLNIAYENELRPLAPGLQYIWYKKIRKTCEKFKQDQLSNTMGYLVLLYAVHEFLEKERDQL